MKNALAGLAGSLLALIWLDSHAYKACKGSHFACPTGFAIEFSIEFSIDFSVDF